MANFHRPDSQARLTSRPAGQAKPLSAFVGRPGAAPVPVAIKDARGPRNEPAREELKICGLAAVKARFERDPGSILRLFFDEPTSRKVGARKR